MFEKAPNFPRTGKIIMVRKPKPGTRVLRLYRKICSDLAEFVDLKAPAAVSMKQVIHTVTMDSVQQKPKEEGRFRGNILYTVDEVPRWYLCFVLGIQQYLMMFGTTVAYSYLVTPKLCIKESDPARGYITSTLFFVSGLGSLIQSTFGTRLPIIQGPSSVFLAPIFAILSLPQWKCPSEEEMLSATEEELQEIWQIRMREIQGAIIAASIFEIIIGLSGVIGIILQWLTPLVIVPSISLIGLSVFKEAASIASKNWGIAIITILLFVLFSQYLENINIPGCSYSRERGWKIEKLPVFKLFPVILTIVTAWVICFILTATDALGPTNPARTDLRVKTMYSSHWFRFPCPGNYHSKTNKQIYCACVLLKQSIRILRMLHFKFYVLLYMCFVKAVDMYVKNVTFEIKVDHLHLHFGLSGQWGLPTVTISPVLGMFAGILASVLKSIGDYYACARLACAPPPPTGAINRGIFAEGISSTISGIWGSGCGMTSYSQNIGAIGITKVASRRVIQYGAVTMMVFAVLGKFGAFLNIIPEPIIGGIICVMFALVTGVGLSNVQFIDFHSSRNTFILGFSLFMGITIPKWFSGHPGAIDVGNDVANQLISVLLNTSVFVGGLIAFVLDNSIPGTEEERGLIKWREQGLEQNRSEGDQLTWSSPSIYDLPFGMNLIKRYKIFKYIPISPTYDQNSLFGSVRSLFKKIIPQINCNRNID
ncbi:solute carrier family 23 member 1-like [Tachypleus tridentatus]|uniref:solute carrier family 23 member 1-like n=1 Tax=Tachypleus tridentatus TaxID=6853 RepID=UPI003FD2DF96